MANRIVPFVQNEFFHVYNRGNSKQKIFLNEADFERFLVTLYLSNTSEPFNIRDILKQTDDVYSIERPDELVRIGAYCLMDNHYHLLISPVVEDGLSKFMQKLSTSYAMYFNTKYERTGSLFEGRFKARHADTDEYLKYLFSYIHLNPVRGKVSEIHNTKDLFAKAKAYPHSSLREYLSPRSDLGLVDTNLYGMYFSGAGDVEREIFEWLSYEEPALGQT